MCMNWETQTCLHNKTEKTEKVICTYQNGKATIFNSFLSELRIEQVWRFV